MLLGAVVAALMFGLRTALHAAAYRSALSPPSAASCTAFCALHKAAFKCGNCTVELLIKDMLRQAIRATLLKKRGTEEKFRSGTCCAVRRRYTCTATEAAKSIPSFRYISP